jgi:hypothetical protein
MMSHDTERTLLLTYFSLIADRNAFGPAEGFEFKLWRDMEARKHTYGSADEYDNIAYLAEVTGCWVTGNLETNAFELIDLDDWSEVLNRE